MNIRHEELKNKYRFSNGGVLRDPMLVMSAERKAQLTAQARKLDADHRRKQGKATLNDNLERLRAAEQGAPTMRDNAERLRLVESKSQRRGPSGQIETRVMVKGCLSTSKISADWWRAEIARVESRTGLRADVIAASNHPASVLVCAAKAHLQALGA